MQVWLEVKNFARIEYAKVCVNKYTLFVGPNNCGKTFLMQLIEGVNEYWNQLIDKNAIQTLSIVQTDDEKEYEVNSNNLQALLQVINANLHELQTSLIRETFGKDIPIGKLSIDIFLDEGETYSIYQYATYEKARHLLDEKLADEELKNGLGKFIDGGWDYITISMKHSDSKNYGKLLRATAWRGTSSETRVNDHIWELFKENSLFMPASRNGLLMLYREFFAHKTDEVISFRVNDEAIDGYNQKREMNLTKPVYKFLRFVQTYNRAGNISQSVQDIISFYYERIIDGHFTVDDQGGLLYSSRGEEGSSPLYLTSSMVNEVAPMFMALTSNDRSNRFVIDEVEASLHPEKQQEFVRFLNRLYNSGYSFIISTHSNTFVNRLNNLVILSNYIQKSGDIKALDKIGLENNDLIKREDLYVYEFVNTENGKSIVQEKKFNEKLGYQFDLFTKSALQIYQEAEKLEEIIENG